MAKALQIVYQFKDNKGKRSTTAVNVPVGITLAGAIEFGQDVAILINNLTTCQVVTATISQPVDLSGLGLPASPGATSDIEEKGVFQYETAGGFKTAVNIPGLSDLLVVDGSDAIDLTEQDVIDWNAMMISGIVPTVYGVLVSPCDTREDDITSLDYARERFRASGKRV